MRTARALPSLLLGLLPSLGLGGSGDGPRWLDDPEQAFALAAESGRPLLVVFR